MQKFLMAAALLAGGGVAAQAQLVGGHAGVGVGVNAPVSGAVGAVGGAAGAATGAVGDTVGAAGQAVDTTAHDAAHATGHAAHQAASAKTVQVKAGARVRVARETRCYDSYNYYDPTYGPDGYYYCESRGPGVAAGASVKTGK